MFLGSFLPRPAPCQELDPKPCSARLGLEVPGLAKLRVLLTSPADETQLENPTVHLNHQGSLLTMHITEHRLETGHRIWIRTLRTIPKLEVPDPCFGNHWLRALRLPPPILSQPSIFQLSALQRYPEDP